MEREMLISLRMGHIIKTAFFDMSSNFLSAIENWKFSISGKQKK